MEVSSTICSFSRPLIVSAMTIKMRTFSVSKYAICTKKVQENVNYYYFLCHRKVDSSDNRIAQLTTITIGTMNMKSDPGVELRGTALHHHPERIKLETAHRKENAGDKFNPFAGPYDITLVKVDKNMEFDNKKVNIIDNFMVQCIFIFMPITRLCQFVCLESTTKLLTLVT